MLSALLIAFVLFRLKAIAPEKADGWKAKMSRWPTAWVVMGAWSVFCEWVGLPAYRRVHCPEHGWVRYVYAPENGCCSVCNNQFHEELVGHDDDPFGWDNHSQGA